MNHDPDTFGQPPGFDQLLPEFRRLCEVIARLRAPDGCPWDQQQTLQSIKPYTLEETYELLEAIDANDDAAIQEELGDVLLQVLLDAQIAADENRFQLFDVVSQVTNKMIRRHPHVFGDASARCTAEAKQHWRAAKSNEKCVRESQLDGIPTAMPQLARAARITSRAAAVGYDFPHRDMLFDKLNEELNELAVELFDDGQIPHVPADVTAERVTDRPIECSGRKARVQSELGDILFVLANIGRRWGINPEEALRESNTKFGRRFQAIEAAMKKKHISIEDATLQQMEEAYQQAKQQEI